MIPPFPALAPLSDEQRNFVCGITDQFLPYSDFSFTSLQAWDLAGKMRVGQHHGNLTVRFHNAETGRFFYSFIGNTGVDDTAHELMAATAAEGLPLELRLVPEETARQLSPSEFEVTEDRDSFDYMLDVQSVAEYLGPEYYKKRQAVRAFWRRGNVTVIALDLQAKASALSDLCQRWEQAKTMNGHTHPSQGLYGACPAADVKAMQRLISEVRDAPLCAVGLKCGSELIAACIYEVVNRSMALLHFVKADCTRYPGAHDVVLQEAARALARSDCTLINYQEDLGVPSLRAAKLRCRPRSFLRKYTVRLLDSSDDHVS